MSSSDAWSRRRAEGFALAATAQADRGAGMARSGLSPAIATEASAVALEVAAMTRGARRAWLHDVLQQPGSKLGSAQPGRPARALGLLATHVERELGRTWLKAAPPPRAGFVADPQLLRLLCALCTRPGRTPAEGHPEAG